MGMLDMLVINYKSGVGLACALTLRAREMDVLPIVYLPSRAWEIDELPCASGIKLMVAYGRDNVMYLKSGRSPTNSEARCRYD